MRATALPAVPLLPILTAPVGAQPEWFQWVGHCEWAKYLATRDTPIVDWTGELVGADYTAGWIRVAKYILYCAPYEGDSVGKVIQVWYGNNSLLQGHVPPNGAPAEFGKVKWGPINEEQYAEFTLKCEYDKCRSNDWGLIRNGKYWIPSSWENIYIGGVSLYYMVEESLGVPFQNSTVAEHNLMKNPMFEAAIRLVYWVASKIPYYGLTNWHVCYYYGFMNGCYKYGPAEVFLDAGDGWNCADHAALTAALYRATGVPCYIIIGHLGNGNKNKVNHAWTAIFVKVGNKWHEVFIDSVD